MERGLFPRAVDGDGGFGEDGAGDGDAGLGGAHARAGDAGEPGQDAYGDDEVNALLEQADWLITRQLEAHEWSLAKDVTRYRRPTSLGNVMLREFDERREQERRSGRAP